MSVSTVPIWLIRLKSVVAVVPSNAGSTVSSSLDVSSELVSSVACVVSPSTVSSSLEAVVASSVLDVVASTFESFLLELVLLFELLFSGFLSQILKCSLYSGKEKFLKQLTHYYYKFQKNI